MVPDDIDPSLRTGEPLLESLDDGFSPPAREHQQQHGTSDADTMLPPELALGTKSPF